MDSSLIIAILLFDKTRELCVGLLFRTTTLGQYPPTLHRERHPFADCGHHLLFSRIQQKSIAFQRSSVPTPLVASLQSLFVMPKTENCEWFNGATHFPWIRFPHWGSIDFDLVSKATKVRQAAPKASEKDPEKSNPEMTPKIGARQNS